MLHIAASSFDLVGGWDSKSIVLVVSPLLALMKDQVAAIAELAAMVSDKESTTLVLPGVGARD